MLLEHVKWQASLWRTYRMGKPLYLEPNIMQSLAFRRTRRHNEDRALHSWSAQLYSSKQDDHPFLSFRQIDELIKGHLKEQKDNNDHPKRYGLLFFHPFVVLIKILNDVVARPIPENNMCKQRTWNMHKASLLGRSCDNDHTALLFPSTLLGIASSWFFILPPTLINS